jgi:hypothetical protein
MAGFMKSVMAFGFHSNWKVFVHLHNSELFEDYPVPISSLLLFSV